MHFAKRSKNRKHIAILLVVAMLLTIMPMAVFASDEETAATLGVVGVASTPSAIQFFADNEQVSTLNLLVGDSVELKTAILNEAGETIEGTLVTVTTDSDIVSYADGMVKTNTAGKTTLTANCDDITATLPITVAMSSATDECICAHKCVVDQNGKPASDGDDFYNWNEECPVCQNNPAACQGKQVIFNEDPGCKHQWAVDGGTYSDIPSSCTYPAGKTFICTCCWEAEWIYTFDETTAPIEGKHYFSGSTPEIVQEATCTTEGLKKQTCLFCDETVETSIPAKGHTPTPGTVVEKSPDCATNTLGQKSYTCETCGETITETIPLKHDFVNGVCETCDATQYEVRTYDEKAHRGDGWDKLNAKVIINKDGSMYGVDANGSVLDDDSFIVQINEAENMGGTITEKNEAGVTVQSVTGWKNGDAVYQVGEKIPYSAVKDMVVSESYNYGKTAKIIYLTAVRESKTITFDGTQSTYVLTESNPALRGEIKGTSDGIETSIAQNETKDGYVLTYTIPQNYHDTTVNINATRDLMNIYSNYWEDNNKFQPGDVRYPVVIEIVNNSGKTFAYEKNSFVLQSPSFQGETPFNQVVNTFDGVQPTERQTIGRTDNAALRLLYGKDSLTKADLKDETLAKNLAVWNYNGVAELHKYYLDYYNATYDGNWKNLSEVPLDLLASERTGILGGWATGQRETNGEVAGIGYNCFYERLFSVVPGGVAKDEAGVYTLGNHMQNHLNSEAAFEPFAEKAWGTLSPSASGALTSMSLYLNGEYTGNAYQERDITFEAGFRLKEVPAGSLVVDKVVSGDAGDTAKDWNFVVALTATNEIPFAAKYPCTYTLDGETTEGELAVTANNEMQFQLKHGQTITIHGLPSETKYQVTEVEANRDGYVTTYTNSTGEIKHDIGSVVNCVNRKQTTTPPSPGGGGDDDDWTPSDKPKDPTTPGQPPTEIDEPEVPLVEPPVAPEEPTEEINAPDVPLTEVPGEPVEEIAEPEVPLGDAPRTGDAAPVAGLVGLLIAAAGGLVATRKYAAK